MLGTRKGIACKTDLRLLCLWLIYAICLVMAASDNSDLARRLPAIGMARLRPSKKGMTKMHYRVDDSRSHVPPSSASSELTKDGLSGSPTRPPTPVGARLGSEFSVLLRNIGAAKAREIDRERMALKRQRQLWLEKEREKERLRELERVEERELERQRKQHLQEQRQRQREQEQERKQAVATRQGQRQVEDIETEGPLAEIPQRGRQRLSRLSMPASSRATSTSMPPPPSVEGHALFRSFAKPASPYLQTRPLGAPMSAAVASTTDPRLFHRLHTYAVLSSVTVTEDDTLVLGEAEETPSDI